MSRWPLVVLGLASGCEWIDDEEDRERRDNDEDGLPLTEDCNDQRAAVGLLPDPERVLPCGEPSPGVVQGADRLGVSTCIHPLTSDSELAEYGALEDLWALEVPSSGVVTVRLSPEPGFTQATGQGDEGPELDLARIVLWAWPEGTCPRDHCNLGLPLALESGALNVDAEVRFEAQAGSDWVLVVSAAEGSEYTLLADCP